jgi:hypothetical protein
MVPADFVMARSHLRGRRRRAEAAAEVVADSTREALASLVLP